MPERTTFAFPMATNDAGRIEAIGGDPGLRARILQVLFTAPGERVNQPEFGCGLFNLVFEPNNDVLAAATQFSVRQALIRWLGDEISVDLVEVQPPVDGKTVIEVAYTKKEDLATQAVRVQFQ